LLLDDHVVERLPTKKAVQRMGPLRRGLRAAGFHLHEVLRRFGSDWRREEVQDYRRISPDSPYEYLREQAVKQSAS